MRILFLAFTLMLINCHQADNKQNDQKLSPYKVKEDTLKLEEVLSFNSLKTTHLLIVNDSVFFITPDPVNNPLYCSIKTFFYNSTNKKFHFINISSAKQYEEVRNGLLKSAHPAIYIKSIGNFKNGNVKLPKELGDKVELKKILNPKTKIELYKGEYFFLNQIFPKELYIYNPKTSKTISFAMTGNIMHVAGFFLYDIDKDDNPEVFIFHGGIVPREDWISYTVYSIRKDSVTVEYK